MKRSLSYLFVLTLLIVQFSCRSYRKIENLPPVHSLMEVLDLQEEIKKLSIGDEILLTFKSGKKSKLVFLGAENGQIFVHVNEEGLPERESIPLTDISGIKVKKFSATKTFLIPIGLIGIGVFVGIMLFAKTMNAAF